MPSNSPKFVFDGELTRAIAAHDQGVNVLCPQCGADLVFATSREEANAARVHPSVFCPIDKAHLNIMLNLSETRGLLRRLFGPGRHEDDED